MAWMLSAASEAITPAWLLMVCALAVRVSVAINAPLWLLMVLLLCCCSSKTDHECALKFDQAVKGANWVAPVDKF
ncbi:hypothetical protein, partial [Hydromonas duriensis]|uniref:hypothetical protein n=1 Tax=Hydromonas duriensis TaxID=1527608 RepID=UPI001B85F7E4